MVKNQATWVFRLPPWARSLISLSLSFLLCTMGMIVGPVCGVAVIEYVQSIWHGSQPAVSADYYLNSMTLAF